MNDTFTEVTIGGRYEYEAEIMVHITSDHRIIRAYTYKSDIPYLRKDWIGEPSKNELFVNLTDKALSSKGLLRSAIAKLKK